MMPIIVAASVLPRRTDATAALSNYLTPSMGERRRLSIASIRMPQRSGCGNGMCERR